MLSPTLKLGARGFRTHGDSSAPLDGGNIVSIYRRVLVGCKDFDIASCLRRHMEVSVLHGFVHTHRGVCVRAHRSLKRPRDLGLAGHVTVVRPWRKASMPVSPAGFGPLHGLSMVYLWSIYGLSYGLSMVYLSFLYVSGIAHVLKRKNKILFERPKCNKRAKT